MGDYVTTEDGTGLVHLAPPSALMTCWCAASTAFRRQPNPPDGTFAANVALVGGQFFKAADADLIADLIARDLLFRRRDYTTRIPHVGAATHLAVLRATSWYIRTTKIKDRLLAANEATNWYPETIKWGRFGDWLRNNVDWALSRNRFWELLPIWRCENDHTTCIGSLEELRATVWPRCVCTRSAPSIRR